MRFAKWWFANLIIYMLFVFFNFWGWEAAIFKIKSPQLPIHLKTMAYLTHLKCKVYAYQATELGHTTLDEPLD